MRTVGIYPGKNALEEQYEEQYDEGYFGRVYRTSVVVFGIAAVMLYGRGGLPALIGFTYGAAVSLASLRAIELFARHFLRPERHLKRARVAMLMVLKLPVLGLVLSGAAWLAAHQVANVFALVGGVALVQTVIFLKTVGAALVAALSPEPVPAQHVIEAVARARRSGAAPVPAHRERAAARARPAGAPAQQGLPAAD